ncbi:MAG: metallophosphoesterase, partial [Anaerolineales bacterium]|nr:metallophosphoesterase [Anaerolineales bacterium]
MPKPKTFVIVGDNHGSEQHTPSVNSLFNFMDDYRPDIVAHLGDNWDFSALRRGARDDEQAVSLLDDWEMGSKFFSRFFSYGKERHFLRGNHDERMWFLRTSTTGLVRDYAEDGIKRIGALAKKHRVKMLPYDAREGVLRLGHLKVLHGFHAGMNAARSHAAV